MGLGLYVLGRDISMKEFANIGAFLKFMEGNLSALESAGHRGVRDGAEIIREEAIAEIGHYQNSAGPYPAWDPLSQATLEGFHASGIGYVPGKVELGFAPPDNPLLRTGELAESIEVTAEGDEAAIGSNEDVAIYQEFGTPDARFPIPPRSFLGGAAVRKGEEAAEVIGAHVVRALVGLPASNKRKVDRPDT